jgi:pimeloyl-ACP methyl ester carboxylesterase
VKHGRTLLAAVAALLALAGPAEAAVDWRPCGGKVSCATLPVPLDRSGGSRAKVGLEVERLRARRGPRRGVTLLLAGGPGQAAIPAFRLREWRRYTPRSDIVTFDQRGTGGSGLIRCRDLESANPLDPTRQAAACAALLGRRRGFYRTSDSVADLEALRRALRAPKLTLIGVSYGTYVAQAYAAAHPTRVNRMVLDSVIDVTGVDPFYRESIEAVPRVLQRLCRAGCRSFTRDPVGDLGRVVAGLAERPGRGYLVGDSGKRRPASLSRQDLLYTLIAGDFDPISRGQFPAAISSALRNDLAPLIRLRRRALGSESVDAGRLFSPAVLAATVCEELAFPWTRFGPLDARPGEAFAAAAALGPEAFAPFDAATGAGNDLIRLCRRWPAATPAPAPLAAPPDVPVLLLEGEQDLRTPVEAATRAAARYARSELVVVPSAGHSVLSGAASGCPAQALERFMRGRKVRPCRRSSPPWQVTRPLPLSLGEVDPFPGLRGVPGRLARAVELTLADVALELEANFDDIFFSEGLPVAPGLRGGRLALRILFGRGGPQFALQFERLEVVPGVRVSGTVRVLNPTKARGKLRVRGPRGSGGLLRVRNELLSGRLGGRRVRFALPEDATGSLGATASLARPVASSSSRREVPRLILPGAAAAGG